MVWLAEDTAKLMYFSNMITALLLSAINAADAFSMQAPVSIAIGKARKLAQTAPNEPYFAALALLGRMLAEATAKAVCCCKN